MSLTLQERIKDLRVERRLTLKELEDQTGLSSSALGSYEADDTKDISHYTLIRLAKFYGVTVDYLLGLTETKSHPNAGLADLRLGGSMIEVLKEGRVDTALLVELVAHLGRSDSAPKNSAAEELKQDLEEVARFNGSKLEQLIMLFCKQTKLRYNKLTEEEKQWLARIAQKSELLKGAVSSRGKKRK